MASRIDTLISKCRSWDEFVELVNALPKTKNKEKGDLFERLTQVYLQTQPTYRSKLKNVYLLSDKTIPEQLRTKLNLPDNDEGIDLVCETYSGEYWSVQCKYKSDQSAALTYKELSTFNSLSFNSCTGISLGLVAHTSTKPVKKSHLMPMVNEIGLEKWLEISDADWKQIISVCRSNRLKPPKKRSPRRHQKAAIADAHNHFVTKKQKRGKLIMPCGTGKSLTAYWIAQALEAKTIVVAVPSLALVRQSLADWTAEYLAEGVTPEWLAVCSDHSVGSMGDADSTVATAYEMGIPTNPSDEELDNFLTKRSKAPKIVFTTYQSAEKLCDASRRNNKTFDLLIADEAHKTVGRKSKSFATLLFDENIKVKRRLFMTATERVYNASRDDVVSMDDPDIYGSTCHQLSFKEAIKQKIICDYKIVTIAVSDAEINALIQEKAELSVSAGNKTIETDAHSLAAGIVMQKAFKKYGIKHAVTFHSSIRRAESFKGQQEDLPNNAHVSHSHISSELSAGQRAKLLRAFAEEELSLVTNARCLTEGVDVKAIDCVAFVDPKQSTVDIVQAAGRAMRQSRETGKEFGYIVLPLIIHSGQRLEELENSSAFKTITKVITALSTQDERIKEELKASQTPSQSLRNKTIDFDENLSDFLSIEIKKVEQALTLRLWSKVAKANWRTFDEARAYTRSLGINSTGWKTFAKSEKRPADIPTNPGTVYKNQGWINFGDWLGYEVKRGNLFTYKQAVEAVRKVNIKSRQDWAAYAKSIDFPSKMPVAPWHAYKNCGWTNWRDFTGHGRMLGAENHLNYKDAKKIVRSWRLQSTDEWRVEIQKPSFPSNIYKSPNTQYRGRGWTDWADFLGTKNKKPNNASFDDSRKFAQSLNLNSRSEWLSFARSPDKPDNIPVFPDVVYKGKGWKGYNNFLGHKGIVTKERRLSFKEARLVARKLKLKDAAEWRAWSRGPLRPGNIPSSPEVAYKNDGWMGFGDWLGTGRIGVTKIPKREFTQARKFVRSLKLKSQKEWRDWCKSGSRPIDIPTNPNRSYKDKGWVNWQDWLDI